MARRQAWLGLLFISPWALGLLLFKLLPILASLGISFTNFYAIDPRATQFVGLQNYVHILSDFEAGLSLVGTLGLALLIVPAQLLAALGFAALLNNKRVKARGLLRALFFMPTIVPATATLVVAFGFLDPDSGWINVLIMKPLGLPLYPGVFSESGYNFLILLLALWSIGPSFLIMLGAMQGVPSELYEAARVDGAGPVYRFSNVTLPMISPAIFFSLIISFVTVFGGVALLDQGTPFGEGISPYDAYIGDTIFHQFEYGYASSLAWAFLAVMVVAVVVLFSTSRYWVHYAEGEHL